MCLLWLHVLHVQQLLLCSRQSPLCPSWVANSSMRWASAISCRGRTGRGEDCVRCLLLLQCRVVCVRVLCVYVAAESLAVVRLQLDVDAVVDVEPRRVVLHLLCAQRAPGHEGEGGVEVGEGEGAVDGLLANSLRPATDRPQRLVQSSALQSVRLASSRGRRSRGRRRRLARGRAATMEGT